MSAIEKISDERLSYNVLILICKIINLLNKKNSITTYK